MSHSGWSSAAGLRRPGRRLSVSSSPQPSVWLGACGPAVLEGWRGIRLLGRCQPCPRELSGRAAEAPVQAWPGVCGAAGRRQRGVDGGQQPSLGPGSGRAAAPVWPSGAGAASAGRAASQPPGGRESSGEQRLPTGGPRAESWRCWSERAPACSPGRVWAEQQAAVAGPAESQSHSLLAEQQIRERERERGQLISSRRDRSCQDSASASSSGGLGLAGLLELLPARGSGPMLAGEARTRS